MPGINLEGLRRFRKGLRLSKVIRAYRNYYKREAKGLYRTHLNDYNRVLLFPFFGQRPLQFQDGTPLHIPRKHWRMLAVNCRLNEIGAKVTWHENEMEVELLGMRFFSPANARLTYLSLKGCLLDDIWKMGRTDLKGKLVLDVGAYMGHFAIACAKRGAVVHAFEPIFSDYVKRNVEANGLQDRVFIHDVGLSDRDEVIVDADDLEEMASMAAHGGHSRTAQATIVEAIAYLKKHSIGKVDFLKMNCEGAEYALLGNDQFLDLLRPELISLEYHGDGEPIYSALRKMGYSVDWPNKDFETAKTKKDGRRNGGDIFAERHTGW